jgi:hypothetical protein
VEKSLAVRVCTPRAENLSCTVMFHFKNTVQEMNFGPEDRTSPETILSLF